MAFKSGLAKGKARPVTLPGHMFKSKHPQEIFSAAALVEFAL